MSHFVLPTDHALIAATLRPDTPRHLYELGDLDMPYAQYARWFGWQTDEMLAAIALLYTAYEPPILIALSSAAVEAAFIRALVPSLPSRLDAHIAVDAAPLFAPEFTFTSYGAHQKMILSDATPIAAQVSLDVRVLTPDDLPVIQALYAAAYPGNHFAASTLDTQRVAGMFDGTTLISIAGIHVWSPVQSVCAIGNVTTHPAYRGRGISRRTCATLVHWLLSDGIAHIGLNVRTDNAAAIALYHKLGFTWVCDYHEGMLTRR